MNFSGEPSIEALPARAKGPAIDAADAMKFTLVATTDRPVWASLKVNVPSSTRTSLTGSAPAPPAEGANAQFAWPAASTSRLILGATRVASVASMEPVIRASSDSRTAIDFASTMLGSFASGGLAKRTPFSRTTGSGSSDSWIGPSIARSRPVACFASAMIPGL